MRAWQRETRSTYIFGFNVRECVLPYALWNRTKWVILRWPNRHFIGRLMAILSYDKKIQSEHKRMLRDWGIAETEYTRCKYSLKLFIIDHKMQASLRQNNRISWRWWRWWWWAMAQCLWMFVAHAVVSTVSNQSVVRRVQCVQCKRSYRIHIDRWLFALHFLFFSFRVSRLDGQLLPHRFENTTSFDLLKFYCSVNGILFDWQINVAFQGT